MTWDECKPFYSFIRAAVEAGLPPKQVIFSNPKHKEYDFWDLRLLQAYYFAQDFTRNGIPVWWDESNDVVFEVKKKVSRSKAAVDRAEKRDAKGDKGSKDGVYYVPVPKTRGGAPFPTFEAWASEQSRLSGASKFT